MGTRAGRTAALLGAAVLVIGGTACGSAAANGAAGGGAPAAGAAPLGVVRVDSARLLGDLERLAHDSLRGRAAGTPENAKARQWIAGRFDQLGLAVVGGERVHPFTVAARGGSAAAEGGNVVGLVRGTERPDRYIVVTAHYDHVGVGRPVEGDSIYNGADDNASGTAALLALAEHFARNPGRHSLLFVAFDAEERGLQGARAFVARPPVPKDAIALNVNMDMVSNSTRGELYAAGAAKYPQLRPLLQRAVAAAQVKLILGHDSPVPTPRDDWTSQSDQGAFHAAGIPFVYFGVEDHPHYHRPSDEIETTTRGFYVSAVRTIGEAVRILDAGL